MLKKAFIPLLFLLFVIAPFSSCFAVPVMYTVNGQAWVGYDTDQYDVSGQLYINDTVEFEDLGDSAVFKNTIPFFCISVGPYSFWGSGVFNSHYYKGEEDSSSFTCPHDGSMLVGEGDWTNWQFLDSGTNFYDENGEVYDKGDDYSDFLNAPYRIYSEFLCNLNYSGLDLVLTDFEISQGGRSANTTPVPEPSTIMLFGLGIAAITTKSRFQKNGQKRRFSFVRQHN